jgi:thiamine biosynthesis lipoprotein
MGTTYTVRVVTTVTWGQAKLDRVASLIQETLDRIDSKMSHYDSSSELSEFNRLRHTEWFEVSPETFAVVSVAQTLSELTGGALDITVAPLVNAWGFGPVEPVQLPPDLTRLSLLKKQVDYTKLELDVANLAVRKTDPAVEWDLSAVAKGYGVDQVAGTLREAGLTRFMIEVGGEITTAGLNQNDQAWRIGIERPTSLGGIQRVVPLQDRAMATSGDRHNTRDFNGQVFSHTIDPRTARPVQHQLGSVSVIADRCVVADGLATALEVLGPDDGYALALERDWAALFLVRHGLDDITVITTPAFEAISSAAISD